jgi:hypothetical protein
LASIETLFVFDFLITYSRVDTEDSDSDELLESDLFLTFDDFCDDFYVIGDY